jgi:hypothetical protein
MYSYKHPDRDTSTVPNEDINQGWIRLSQAFMVSCSIIRAVGDHGLAPEYQWQALWLQTEACIGVMMGSITIYHSTLLTGSSSGVSWLAKIRNLV